MTMQATSTREDELMGIGFDPKPVRLGPREAILYALGLGIGDDPLDPRALAYVYEKDLAVFPTMPVVLGSPGMWFDRAGLDFRKLVHAGQTLDLARPIPLDVPMVATNRIIAVYDKGADKGVIIEVERQLATEDGALVATSVSQYLCRGDGGFGGTQQQPRNDWQKPGRAPDARIEIATLPQQALIYRLNGDMNPLHIDPERARSVGFDRPILHGLCTFGIAGRAMLAAKPGAALKALSVRMAKPVYPGETLLFEVWGNGPDLQFEASVPSRDAVVLAAGTARVE
ncbi:MaoC/PaaZ C-terminal domain-containing protein [Pararhodobacter aggregans]|uniref:MaoC/PaaZ C-terminal domain-containing protein n=1 Tax=Pararhodobacter aggregans TaxID=404875 RepID=UPI003A92ABC1